MTLFAVTALALGLVTSVVLTIFERTAAKDWALVAAWVVFWAVVLWGAR